LNGSVANVPLGSGGAISMGGSFAFVSGSSTFQLMEVPDGAVDLVANREIFGTTGGATPDRVIVRRALNLAAGGTIPVLDFGASEALAPATNTATVGGLQSGESNSLIVFFTTNTQTSQTSHFLSFTSGFTSGSQTIYGIPSTLTAAGDVHDLSLFAGTSDFTAGRNTVMFYRNPGDKTITLGPTLNAPTFTTVASTPYVRQRGQLASQSDYNSVVFFSWSQSSETTGRHWSVAATSGFFGGTPATWDLQIPDLSGVTGFPTTSAGLQTGQSTDAFAEAGNIRPELLAGGAPQDGDSFKFAFREVTVATSLAAIAHGVRQRPSLLPGSRF
jgi:hypothetical protein